MRYKTLGYLSTVLKSNRRVTTTRVLNRLCIYYIFDFCRKFKELIYLWAFYQCYDNNCQLRKRQYDIMALSYFFSFLHWRIPAVNMTIEVLQHDIFLVKNFILYGRQLKKIFDGLFSEIIWVLSLSFLLGMIIVVKQYGRLHHHKHNNLNTL